MSIRIQKLQDNAIAPKRQTHHSAGYDLYANQGCNLLPGESCLIGTGIAMEIPDGFVGLIMSRSGSAVKHGIEKGAGVIDSDYRGEVKVLLRNFSNDTFFINPGDRIAQMIIVQYLSLEIEEVERLTSTDRGEGGFGSTGKR